MTDTEIGAVIDRVVRERLAGHRIISVLTERDNDFEGNEILAVNVVIGDDIRHYDGASLASLVRLIRGALKAGKVGAFPLIRFMSQSEARELAA